VRASAGRIRSFIAQPFTVDDAVGPAPAERVGAPVVEVDGVTVDGWGPLSFSVAPAEMVGVVADPSMASALVDLLGRTRDPDGGEIKLHGVPIRSVPLVELRRRVVATRHDAALFSGTIREQLDVPISGSVTSPDVEALLASTAAADVVRTVPGGLDAVVGTAGRSLSGGQRQRLVLSRSLATGAEVIVLHDPTTAVDASTEAAIAHGVRRVRAEATTIIITTSPALLAVCDRVLVVVDGAVQAVGNHADLLADERYAALVLG
jgi:putative ABC transport system ATP-binding protein